MIDGLKLCPFCDGAAKIYHRKSGVMNEFYYVVTCLDCDAESALCETDDEAVEKWNTRASDADLSTIEAIDSAIDVKYAEINKLIERKHDLKVKE